ncbi:hypothetical protein CEXT_565341 [Caerostris extrusa]|uniref:Uncharacterized protein n=1 Tax=Caerostris extrusa TaxID=172846 RepID=A0AAV4XCT0_CAEEX|nr:hypothetical protein CEXT_565341 [Caerostris extrusa]
MLRRFHAFEKEPQKKEQIANPYALRPPAPSGRYFRQKWQTIVGLAGNERFLQRSVLRNSSWLSLDPAVAG